MKSHRPKWKYRTRDWLHGSPVVAGGLVYIGGYDKKLHAVDADSGEQVWEFATQGAITTSPVIGNGRIFFGSVDGFFYAVR
jgi:outer membrane protein assembly factor BamB